MALTEQQLEFIMHQDVERIMQFISEGRVKFPEDLIKYKNNAKFAEIQKRFANMPDPAAATKWYKIKAKLDAGDSSQTIIRELSSFVNAFADNSGCAQMVKSARSALSRLTEAIEAADWDKIDTTSITALLAHRRKYPTTSHASDIDHMVWNLTDRSKKNDIIRYQREFPEGQHRPECDAILEAQDLWRDVSTDPDLLTVSDYIQEVTDSPFIDDAVNLLVDLKAKELDFMKKNPATYNLANLGLLLENGIFTRKELLLAGVCTPKTIKFIENPEELPDIEQVGDKNPVIHKGATDVFLFGVPSSGKTCVLMGLLGATEFSYDNAATGSGGNYADKLTMYRRHGKAPGRTYGNFVTQIHGAISPEPTPDAKGQVRSVTYPINLIEMSGEEFAMKIAYNANNYVEFESMGTGATRLLTSDNRKVIFIIIDPSADGLIKISTEAENGASITNIVQQDIVINKIVNMLSRNTNVLKRTNAIHFIMTKADTLGDREEREGIAVERIRELYRHTIKNLKKLCAEHGINATSNGSPLLYTFSLGTFYIGDLFEYDITDANKIMDGLKSMCQGQKSEGFGSIFKKTVN